MGGGVLRHAAKMVAAVACFNHARRIALIERLRTDMGRPPTFGWPASAVS
jgi:hypothetical protein